MTLPSQGLKQIDIIKIYNTKKCLVVDDFPEIRGSLSRILKNFGAKSVDTAADGDEAVRLCSQHKYDMVLCDYNLGQGKDGQQTLEEVRFLRVLPVTSLFVMLTGESSRALVLGALECQPDDYITKPYTENSLRTRLDRAILRHEALMPIKEAIHSRKPTRALKMCSEMIQSGSRYAAECLKIKAKLLLELKQFDEALQIYNAALANKPFIWARLGKARAFMEKRELEHAEEICEGIILEDDRYIEAHDLLAEIQVAKHDTYSAQKTTERATLVSPKSTIRHRHLAELADQNHDDELSAKCHLNAIKWGINSCHESAQDYFNYARKVSDIVSHDHGHPDLSQMTKQAGTYLDRARKRFSQAPEVGVQADMVQAQVLNSLGRKDEAKALADKGQQAFNRLRAPSVETSLELARTLYALSDEAQARAVLASLAAQNPNDDKLMRVIDSITSEPLSDSGKGIATQLTKEGINAYETKAYAEAIDIFTKAINSYPKHIGLNLNLIQAIISSSEQDGALADHEKLCRRALRAVGKIQSNHKQFKRYAFLQKQVSKFYPNALAGL